jgi:hypothetical protein
MVYIKYDQCHDGTSIIGWLKGAGMGNTLIVIFKRIRQSVNHHWNSITWKFSTGFLE